MNIIKLFKNLTAPKNGCKSKIKGKNNVIKC